MYGWRVDQRTVLKVPEGRGLSEELKKRKIRREREVGLAYILGGPENSFRCRCQSTLVKLPKDSTLKSDG